VVGRERGPAVTKLSSDWSQEHGVELAGPAGWNTADGNPLRNREAALAATTRALDVLEDRA
jgi:hypothetical protein